MPRTAAVVAELADYHRTGVSWTCRSAGVFALDDVRDAYRELEKRHTRGKLGTATVSDDRGLSSYEMFVDVRRPL